MTEREVSQKPTLASGMLAYYDSLLGLIPCRVNRIWVEPGVVSGCRVGTKVELVLTSGKYPPYKRGEVVVTNAWRAVPRKAVKVRSYNYRIGPYEVKEDADGNA